MRRRPDGRAEDGTVQLEAQLVKQVSVAKTQSAVHRNSGINRFAHAEEKLCIYPTSPQLDQGLTEVQYISKKKDFRCCPRRFVLKRTGWFLESTQRFNILQVLCSHTEVIMLVEDTQLTGLEAAAPTCPSVALPDESDHNLISITTASHAQKAAPAAFTLRKLYASGVFCGHEDGLR